MTSLLGVPIQSRDAVFGNLYLTDRAGGDFGPEDEEPVLALAATAGVAIENADSVQRRPCHPATVRHRAGEVPAIRSRSSSTSNRSWLERASAGQDAIALELGPR